MIKRLVDWLLAQSIYIVFIGLGLFGMAAYTSYKASVGGKIPPEAELVAQSGIVVEGREVIEETRRRRSARKTTKKYYELDLKVDSGEILKLRVDYAVPKAVLEQIIEESVSVKYDKSDGNTAYVIRFEGKDLVSYSHMAAVSQGQADAEKERFASSGTMGIAAVMVLLGAGGFVLRRKMQGDDEENHESVPVPEVRIGSNLAKDEQPVFDKEAGFNPAPPPLPPNHSSSPVQGPKA